MHLVAALRYRLDHAFVMQALVTGVSRSIVRVGGAVDIFWLKNSHEN
jgi:hypothetical protein